MSSYAMMKMPSRPPLHGGAAFGVEWKDLMPSLRNAWNTEAYDEDKRVNRKVYERTASQLSAFDTSTPIPALRLRAVLSEVTTLLNKINETISSAVTEIQAGNPADLSQISVEWNELVGKANPLLIGPVNVGMSDEDTNALHSLITRELMEPLETLQEAIANSNVEVTNSAVVMSNSISDSILLQVRSKYYKPVKYGPERRMGPAFVPSVANYDINDPPTGFEEQAATANLFAEHMAKFGQTKSGQKEYRRWLKKNPQDPFEGVAGYDDWETEKARRQEQEQMEQRTGGPAQQFRETSQATTATQMGGPTQFGESQTEFPARATMATQVGRQRQLGQSPIDVISTSGRPQKQLSMTTMPSEGVSSTQSSARALVMWGAIMDKLQSKRAFERTKKSAFDVRKILERLNKADEKDKERYQQQLQDATRELGQKTIQAASDSGTISSLRGEVGKLKQLLLTYGDADITDPLGVVGQLTPSPSPQKPGTAMPSSAKAFRREVVSEAPEISPVVLQPRTPVALPPRTPLRVQSTPLRLQSPNAVRASVGLIPQMPSPIARPPSPAKSSLLEHNTSVGAKVQARKGSKARLQNYLRAQNVTNFNDKNTITELVNVATAANLRLPENLLELSESEASVQGFSQMPVALPGMADSGNEAAQQGLQRLRRVSGQASRGKLSAEGKGRYRHIEVPHTVKGKGRYRHIEVPHTVKGKGRWTDYSGPNPGTISAKGMSGGNYRDTMRGNTSQQTHPPQIPNRDPDPLYFNDENNDTQELGGMARRDEMLGTENREAHLDPDWKGLPKRWGIERRYKKLRKGYVGPKDTY